MEINFSELNIGAIITSILAGQVISTIWFVAIIGELWAKEYGAKDRHEHTKDIPMYTYFVGLVCTTLLVFSIAILQQLLKVNTIVDAVYLACYIVIGFAGATSLPGHAFLKRWSAFLMIIGSQFFMILGISMILVLWK